MAEISLTKGYVAIVDDADLPLIEQHAWHASVGSSGHVYATTNVPKAGGGQRRIKMHRLLLGEPDCYVDHRNRDTLDNRRTNLRLATPGQNKANSRAYATSGFKGVKQVPSGRWAAYGKANGTNNYLGSFDTAEDAARAYDAWAIEVHGEFAHPNFPLDRAASNQAQGAIQP